MAALTDGRLDALRDKLWRVNWESRFRDRIGRVVEGLKAAPGTGERKYALLELKRLWSHFAAVLVPVAAFLILALTLAPRTETWYRSGVEVDYERKPEPKPLDRLERPRPNEDVPRSDPNDVRVAVPALVEVPAPGPPSPVPSETVVPITALGRVAPIRSPITMRGIYQQRLGAEGRAAAIRARHGDLSSEDAVMRALRWLKIHQAKDGSWHLGSGGGPGHGAAPAMTGLALLAFLAHGETPDDRCPEFGDTVRTALEWLMAAQIPTGRFRGQDDHEYGHPIAAYALCEGYGLTRNPVLRDVASKAVSIIVNGQNADGGWNYNCRPSHRNDTSHTGWCVQALKAADIAGVPCAGLEESLRRSVDGVRRNAAVAHDGFGYTGPGRHHLTCVGVLALQLLGASRSAEVKGGLAVLGEATCDWDAPWGRNPVYYWYYITQAKFYADDTTWLAWNRQFAGEFVRNQTVLSSATPTGPRTGYWRPAARSEHCRSLVYTTALCTLSLEVYYRILGSLDKGAVARHSVFEIDTSDEVIIKVVGKEGVLPHSRRAL